MKGNSGLERSKRGEQRSEDLILVRCTADPLKDDLDVDWTKGAIYEFESDEAVQRWLTRQNARVPGRLFITKSHQVTGPLDVDYYIKYQSGDH